MKINFKILGTFVVLTVAIFIILTYETSCQPTNKNKAMAIQEDILPAEYYGWDAASNKHHFFRVITLENDLFDYRKPDYKGGFYLRFQLADATEQEYKRQVPFDNLGSSPKDYLAHFIAAGSSDIGGGFQMPSYNIWYIQLDQTFDPCTFNFNKPNEEWMLYNNGWASGLLPDPMLLFTRLNLYSSSKQDSIYDLKALEQAYISEMEQARLAGKERCDLALIEQLNQDGKFDTIISRADHTLYVNTDMEYYEQPSAPENFRITYKKFYPNGTLKECRHFLPGIYTSNSLPMGISAYYDEAGTLVDVTYPEQQLFPFYQMANVDFLLRLLEYEGWIDRKTGKGKAVMRINSHVNPHRRDSGERLEIRSPWQIQASDEPNSTVGLLVSDDGAETVYIIDKNSRTILQKFRR